MSVASVAGYLGSSGTLPTPIKWIIPPQSVDFTSPNKTFDYLVPSGSYSLTANKSYFWYMELIFDPDAPTTTNFTFQNNILTWTFTDSTGTSLNDFTFAVSNTYIDAIGVAGGCRFSQSGIFTMNSTDTIINSLLFPLNLVPTAPNTGVVALQEGSYILLFEMRD